MLNVVADAINQPLVDHICTRNRVRLGDFGILERHALRCINAVDKCGSAPTSALVKSKSTMRTWNP
jgi:hypothetical protein